MDRKEELKEMDVAQLLACAAGAAARRRLSADRSLAARRSRHGRRGRLCMALAATALAAVALLMPVNRKDYATNGMPVADAVAFNRQTLGLA